MTWKTRTLPGIATFEDLSINSVGVGYTLVATVNPPAPTISVTGDPFDVANQVTPCTGSTCTATGTTGSVTSTVTATTSAGCSRAGSARLQLPRAFRLGVTVAGSIDIPAVSARPDATPFQQYGEEFRIHLHQGDRDQPSFKIVAVLDKEVVRTKPGNPGATKWDICLGAINVLNPPVGLPNRRPSPSECDQPAEDLMEDEGRQLRDFQGRLLLGAPCELPEQGEDPTSPGSGLFPGVLSKMKDNAGDLCRHLRPVLVRREGRLRLDRRRDSSNDLAVPSGRPGLWESGIEGR